MNKVNTILKFEGVEKTFHNGSFNVNVLKDINLEVKCSEIILLRGPNGSGKTTLLSIAGCLLKPTKGKAFLLNERIDILNENDACSFRLRNIGFIFQSFRLINSLNIIENILFVLKLAGSSNHKARDRALGILEEVGIESKAKFFPGVLSAGEKQLAAVARAIVNDPPVIIADEPTASLDSSASSYVMEYLYEAARKRNKTVIIASHDERLIKYSDRIISIGDGVLNNY
jgi:putative ABC transport system ATP-binding protein